MAARDRLREYFLAHIGEVLDSDTLRQVGDISEWARRVRELRDDEGYEILTHNDRADLKPGEYLLTNPKPRPVIARDVSKETRALVLDRNGYTCQMCGVAAGDEHPDDDDRPARLHIAHIVDKSRGGGDEPSNLRALCSVCNEGSANITLARPDEVTLLAQVRRGDQNAQLAVLKWLLSKFPAESGDS